MSPGLRWNLRERSGIIYRVLHVLDCLMVCLLLWVLVKLYGVPWSVYYTRLELVVFIASFISFYHFQLYRSWRGWKYYKELLVIVQAWASVVGVLLLYFFLGKISEAYSRFVFIVWVLIAPVCIFLLHLLVRKILHYYRTRGKNIRHAVIVGAGELGQRMRQQLQDVPWAGIEVVGFFDDKVEEKGDLGAPLLGKIDEVRDYLASNDIDYVYIALPMRAERKVFKLLRECRDLGANMLLVPDLYIYGLHHAEIQSVGDMLLLSFNPDSSWKRTFDVCFSIFVLTSLSPLFLLIAILIKLDSRGPVFYRHTRVTTCGRRFNCLKFRTMVAGAESMLDELLEQNPEWREEWEKNYKIKQDPRVTRVGRFLRKTSLDELPQFVNVLRGQMSVVGARPVVGKELEDFYKANGDTSAGLYVSMKPGVTGPWQVMGRSDIEDYKERVELDDWYVLNYSLLTDIKIILKTICKVFTGKGAY